MCAAKRHVRFTPNSDRESGHEISEAKILLIGIATAAAFDFGGWQGGCASKRSTAANRIPHCGISWQLFDLLCHFEARQQLDITWCATGCDKAIAVASLCCAVLAPGVLEFAARVLLISLA
jgi:hypothetical protein